VADDLPTAAGEGDASEAPTAASPAIVALKVRITVNASVVAPSSF
jgi:hypothetical protein